MIIEFYTKHVYGSELLYVANQRQAEAIQALTGQKTLLQKDFKALRTLGFEFEQVLPPFTKDLNG